MLNNIKSFNAPEIEEKVLDFWKKKDIFKKTLKPKKEGKEKTFNFWEGPPYANGRPGIHHVLSRVFKDVFLRYKTMKGFVVPRKAGWDTHGLPVEIEAEKALGVDNKKAIEEIGIEKFNEKAKEAVFKYKEEWEKMTERIGYWLDLDNAYMTYTPDFIESLWWTFSKINDRGYLKEFYKILPYCPRCETALSSHELGQPGVYREVEDPSIFIKFPIKGKKDEYILVWTTTPWTLSANVAIAFDKDIRYKKYKVNKEIFWAYNIPEELLGDSEVKILEEKKGKEFEGIEYEPLYKLDGDIKLPKKLYTMHSADFVSTEDGTGFVHIAPTFGEDDFNLIFKDGISGDYKIPETITEEGKVSKGFIGEGMFVKEADKIILEDLTKRNLLFANKKEKHEYPHCWRCDSPLLYSARKSWFFEMSRLRDDLVKSNEKVNWVPDYIKYGRFGEWISQARDWAISRERYWGTPLPIWRCSECDNVSIADSLEYLNKNRFNKNQFLIMRHGEADANVGDWLASEESKGAKISHLTKKGIKQVEDSSKKLSKEDIDIIFASPFERTQRTAEIVSKETGVKVITDKRLSEIKTGNFNNKKVKEYHKEYPTTEFRFENAPEGGETLADVRKRVFEFIKDINSKYSNKKILIVAHGDALWMLESAVKNMEFKDSDKIKYIKTGEFRKIELNNFPADSYGLIDIHRPYVDDVYLKCDKCGEKMERVVDVADVWFDSGAMPYASNYFPFDKKSIVKKDNKELPSGFPADFISEGIDQTRGWFYTLMATSTLLGFDTPYKNVISLGLVLDKNGKKMSKSKGNVVDPWSVISKSGVDSIRWYFYTITSPAEPKNFDPNEVVKTFRRFMLMLYNSYSFLNLYGKKEISIKKKPNKGDLLDKWIVMKTEEYIQETTEAMENYDAMKACQSIEALINDLSRWYIRRSRKKFQKPDTKKELEEASESLAYVLLQVSKIIAPFTPFFAEALYQSLKEDYKFDSKESVHLEDWAEIKKTKSEKLIEKMEIIRNIASEVLSKRAEEGIKVRQPLSKLIIKKKRGLSLDKELLDVLADEINVKEIVLKEDIKEDFILDTEITQELKEEGRMRELVRTIQGLRQDAHYIPSNNVDLWIKAEDPIKSLIEKNEKELEKLVGARKIILNEDVKKFDAETETRIDGSPLWLAVKKI